jgi:iron-sulfur cluster assembly accessory protein
MSLGPASKIDPDEDTVFEADPQGPETSLPDVADGGDAKVVMDLASLELLHGSTVDFTTELIGSQFTIVGNPRATSNCGCGTSFDVK